MLSLTRRENEAIVLETKDGAVLGRIYLGKGNGKQSRIHLDFPPEILIRREELPKRKPNAA